MDMYVNLKCKTDSIETLLGKRVVLNLTKNIYGHFHKIFFDIAVK